MTSMNRRTVLGVGAAVPVAGGLTACGGSDSAPVATPSVPTGELIGTTQDVPVGGCAVFPDSKIVVTQPEEGEYKAFSAVCTHQGCLVSSASEGDIPCRCHMSRFSPQDGSVVSGPADASLPAVEITVDGTDIRAV